MVGTKLDVRMNEEKDIPAFKDLKIVMGDIH